MLKHEIEEMNEATAPFVGKTSEDTWFKFIVMGLGIGVPIFLLFLYLEALLSESRLAIETFGFEVITNTRWDPVKDIYGVGTFIYGTIMTSILAIIIALPISIMASIYIYEFVPIRYKKLARTLVDLLAAIPSVIYGLWGIFVLIPFLRNTLFAFLEVFGVKITSGYSIFTAGLVLAIMITPILMNIIIEGFDTVPVTLKEAMISLGATRWEVSRKVVLPTTKTTVFVALMLGLGRALGETMAVTMVIGNDNNPPTSLFDIFSSGQTISSLIANEFSEAAGQLYFSMIFELALILFVITFFFNTAGIFILNRLKEE
ncbi:MAG: phosphate ABC transporter permease subunit PstC [Methanobacteriota archaeon]|nr:MAG: phosphate ABC transporter permease subunit PstC [Euryarchaeota archaeon]